MPHSLSVKGSLQTDKSIPSPPAHLILNLSISSLFTHFFALLPPSNQTQRRTVIFFRSCCPIALFQYTCCFSRSAARPSCEGSSDSPVSLRSSGPLIRSTASALLSLASDLLLRDSCGSSVCSFLFPTYRLPNDAIVFLLFPY